MILAPRWHKVLRDIVGSPGRTSLAVTAMAAGVFGLGAVLAAYSILGRELAATYDGTHPASAVLSCDDVSDQSVELARRTPGVLDAEARPVIRGRIRVGDDEWMPLVLFVVRDFSAQRIDTVVTERPQFSAPGAPKPGEGSLPLGDDDVLLERTALSVARAGVGDRITVRIGTSEERSLRLTGTVHAAGLAPAWMEHVVYGFVSWTSVMRADAPAGTGRLRIVVSEKRLDEDHILEVASRVRTALESQGRRVSAIDMPSPGRHPHADQMDAFLFLLGAFALLTLCLSAVLVASMIHGLLAEQIRQIGSMKSVGASTRQVAGLYLGHVSILAAISLVVSMPFAWWAGAGYADFAATILNATMASHAVSAWVLAVQIAVGMGVPLLVALVPVYRASCISIHEAFSNDVGRRPFGVSRFDRWLARISWLPRPLMLSLRTVFHRRGRLVLTVGTLAAGGVVFVSALSVSAAWSRAIAKDAEARRYDIEVRLLRPYPVAELADALRSLPDVARAEYWPEVTAVLAGTEGRPRLLHGISTDGTRVTLIGPDPETTLFDLPMLSGRWLRPDDGEVAVISPSLLVLDPTLHVGGHIVLRIGAHSGGRTASWPIVGIAKELFPGAVVYAPTPAVRDVSGLSAGMGTTVRIQTRRHDAASQLSAAQDLDRTFARLGVPVGNVLRLLDRRKAFEDHLVIIVTFLLLAACLVILVGGMGLTSTLTLNVIERTRDIGVLGAIGATPRTIARHVMFEGLLIGVLSWGVAVMLATPIIFALCAVTGQIFIRTSIDFFMSPGAVAAWLALVVLLASLCSWYPARRAARLTVREALTYA